MVMSVAFLVFSRAASVRLTCSCTFAISVGRAPLYAWDRFNAASARLYSS